MPEPAIKKTKTSGVGRKANFKVSEIEMLVQKLKPQPWLYNNESGFTNDQRRIAWEAIAEDVNQVGGLSRSGTDIKKKWSDIKNSVKVKCAKMKRSHNQTGGGSPSQTPELSSFEKTIESMIPAVSIEGVLGGVDFAAGTFGSSSSYASARSTFSSSIVPIPSTSSATVTSSDKYVSTITIDETNIPQLSNASPTKYKPNYVDFSILECPDFSEYPKESFESIDNVLRTNVPTFVESSFDCIPFTDVNSSLTSNSTSGIASNLTGKSSEVYLNQMLPSTSARAFESVSVDKASTSFANNEDVNLNMAGRSTEVPSPISKRNTKLRVRPKRSLCDRYRDSVLEKLSETVSNMNSSTEATSNLLTPLNGIYKTSQQIAIACDVNAELKKEELAIRREELAIRREELEVRKRKAAALERLADVGESFVTVLQNFTQFNP